MTLSGGPRETLYTSDRLASDLAELALTLGEGPSIEAGTGGPVLIADLAATSCRARWPAFSSAAVAIGVGATFALPLRAVVALVRPRACAYANDRSLRDVPRDVVATAAVRT